MRALFVRFLGLAFLMAPLVVLGQSWDYKAVKKGRNGETEVAGSLTLDESSSPATLTIQGPGGACYGRPQPVQVLREEGRITIEQIEALSGCERLRFVIRADGSGGFKELRKGEAWARSNSDPGLRLRR